MTKFISIERDHIRLCHGEQVIASRALLPTETTVLVAETADWVAQQIESAGLPKTNWMLGLHSSFVFFSNCQLERSIVQNPTALTYALEDQLPIEAEQMLVCAAAGSPDSFVTLDFARIEAFVQQLNREYDLAFSAVVSLALCLAEFLHTGQLQKALQSTSGFDSKTQQILLASETEQDFFEFRDGQLTQWTYSLGSHSEFFEHGNGPHVSTFLKYTGQSFGLRTEGNKIEVEDSARATVANAPLTLLPPDDYRDGPHYRLSEQTAVGMIFDQLQQRKFETPFDFSAQINHRLGINQSGTTVWELVGASVLLALVALAGVLFYRATQWDRVAIGLDDQNRSAFRQLLPDRRINGPVEKLLKAELRQQQIKSQLVRYTNRTANLFWTTEAVFKSLGTIGQSEVVSIAILPDAAVIRGTVKSLAHLDRLKTALQSAGFEIGADSNYALNFELSLKRPEDQVLLAQSGQEASNEN